MAKSKSGGTRSLIRGRVGSDVYSIGKDGKGKRQQVVRSIAETVANPRTAAQMANRMYMSTVMQAVAAMSAIIDHSFDGLPKGQPSISEFIRRNYNLVKADAIAHPSSGNKFGLNKYQEKGAKVGKYAVSAGSLITPSAVSVSGTAVEIALTADTLTVGGLKAALGITADGYFTVLVLDETYGFQFKRFHINSSVADSTALTTEALATVFETEGDANIMAVVSTTKIIIAANDQATCLAHACIFSDMENGAWIHNNASFAVEDTPQFNSDTALPTYPTGSEAFLNGGDL